MMPSKRWCFTWTAVAILLLVQAAMPYAQGQRGSATSQAQRPEWMSLTIIKVKPGMATAFHDFVKSDILPTMKKTGVPWSLAYTSAPFGDWGSFAFASPIANFAQYDQPDPFVKAIGPEGIAKLDAKVATMVESIRTVGLLRRPDLSIENSSATEPARLIAVASFTVAPGKMEAFSAFVKTDIIPLYKKTGVVKDMNAFMTIFGEPQGTVTFVSSIPNYAELDLGPPLERAVKGEALKQLEARANGLVTGVSVEINRLIPELSFGTPGTPPTARK